MEYMINSDQYVNPSLKKLSDQYKEKREEIDNIRKNWNQLTRNFLSKSMGVTLAEGDFRHHISINICPSHDNTFMDIIEDNFPDLDFQEYFLLNQYLESAEQASEYYQDSKALHQLNMSQEYARYRLKDFDILDITKNVFRFLEPKNKDVFGCYNTITSRIELYVFPIVLFCQLHGLDLESFVVMVLTHELAHAYNHIGRDKDGQMWENFHLTDDSTAEGLAQYYTHRFLIQYQYRNPKFPAVFDKTLEMQPREYACFKDWDASLEQVYRAFIHTRRNGVMYYEDFSEAIKEAKKAIR